MNRQGVDLAFHHVGQGTIHQALGREPCLALKARRHDLDAKMTSAARGTRVPSVRRALVDDLYVCGVQGVDELFLDSFDPAL